jgi:hypothetical protein
MPRAARELDALDIELSPEEMIQKMRALEKSA